MFYFIDILRILAMCLITNAHYEDIYPISIIANGGLLGDVIFFAVSGFCLLNIKDSFFKWYKRRISRIYPTVWIVTTIYILAGYYIFDFNINSFISIYIYPTKYHFISSIIILYIFYYFIISLINKLNISKSYGIKFSILVISVIYLLYYLLFFDKTYYHVDSVYENSIRFLFLLAMLIGAYYRINSTRFINNFSIRKFIGLFSGLILYFASKLLFSRSSLFIEFQIVNQVILLFVMCCCIECAMSLENQFINFPKKIQKAIKYLSRITLEVYLIQYLIIQRFNIFSFPMNFIVVTLIILVSAIIIKSFINYSSKLVQYGIEGGRR